MSRLMKPIDWLADRLTVRTCKVLEGAGLMGLALSLGLVIGRVL